MMKAATSTRPRPAQFGWDELLDNVRQHHGLQLSAERAYRLVSQGMPARLVDPISQTLGMAKADLAILMGLDRSTATRLSAADKTVPMHSAESVLRLLELHELATDVFGTLEQAKAWLQRPHPLFDEAAPVEAARSSYGAQRVKDMLVSIKYGGVV